MLIHQIFTHPLFSEFNWTFLFDFQTPNISENLCTNSFDFDQNGWKKIAIIF